jgi:hypothetical protein
LNTLIQRKYTHAFFHISNSTRPTAAAPLSSIASADPAALFLCDLSTTLSGLTPATPDRQTSPADVICVPAPHPPFSGAQPGVASRIAHRLASFLSIARARVVPLLAPLPPSIPRQVSVSTAIRPPHVETPNSGKGRWARTASAGHLRHSRISPADSLRGDSFRGPLLLGLQVLRTPRVLNSPVYSGTGLFTHLHATHIATPAIAALAARSSACDWRLDRSGRPHHRRIVSRPARRNPTQEPVLLQ